jgi:hypothetical protein
MKNTKPISLRPLLVSASVEFLGEEEMDCLTTQDGLGVRQNSLFEKKGYTFVNQLKVQEV